MHTGDGAQLHPADAEGVTDLDLREVVDDRLAVAQRRQPLDRRRAQTPRRSADDRAIDIAVLRREPLLEDQEWRRVGDAGQTAYLTHERRRQHGNARERAA